MNHRRRHTAHKPARKMPVWFAVLSMMLQIVFSAEHASASAAATALGGPVGMPVGFLQICTAEGLVRVRMPMDGGLPDPQGAGGGEACAICGVAAVSGATEAPLPLAPAVPHYYAPPVYETCIQPAPARPRLAPAHKPRAPPLTQI